MTEQTEEMEMEKGLISTTAQAAGLAQASLMDEWIRGKSPLTVRAYQGDIRQFAEWCKVHPAQIADTLLGLTSAEGNGLVLRYRNSMIDSGTSSSVINRRLAAIRSLMDLANQVGVSTWRLSVKGVQSEPRKDNRGPEIGELRDVFALPDQATVRGVRDYAILRLLFDLGLRREEVCSLNWINIHPSEIAVTRKKHREKSTTPLSQSAATALQAWKKLSPDTAEAVFVSLSPNSYGQRMTGASVWRMVSQYGSEIGINLRPHGIRHTSITEVDRIAAERGLSLAEVQIHAGHKHIDTTMKYRDSNNAQTKGLRNTLGGLI